ncbi:MAG: hypothetical protein ABH879_08800 [archaeon]
MRNSYTAGLLLVTIITLSILPIANLAQNNYDNRHRDYESITDSVLAASWIDKIVSDQVISDDYSALILEETTLVKPVNNYFLYDTRQYVSLELMKSLISSPDALVRAMKDNNASMLLLNKRMVRLSLVNLFDNYHFYGVERYLQQILARRGIDRMELVTELDQSKGLPADKVMQLNKIYSVDKIKRDNDYPSQGTSIYALNQIESTLNSVQASANPGTSMQYIEDIKINSSNYLDHSSKALLISIRNKDSKKLNLSAIVRIIDPYGDQIFEKIISVSMEPLTAIQKTVEYKISEYAFPGDYRFEVILKNQTGQVDRQYRSFEYKKFAAMILACLTDGLTEIKHPELKGKLAGPIRVAQVFIKNGDLNKFNGMISWIITDPDSVETEVSYEADIEPGIVKPFSLDNKLQKNGVHKISVAIKDKSGSYIQRQNACNYIVDYGALAK